MKTIRRLLYGLTEQLEEVFSVPGNTLGGYVNVTTLCRAHSKSTSKPAFIATRSCFYLPVTDPVPIVVISFNNKLLNTYLNP